MDGILQIWGATQLEWRMLRMVISLEIDDRDHKSDHDDDYNESDYDDHDDDVEDDSGEDDDHDHDHDSEEDDDYEDDGDSIISLSYLRQ